MGGSGSGTSAELVDLKDPVAGTYTVYVHGWQTDGPDANFTLFSWVVGNTAAGNMTVTAPASAVVGDGTITLDFTGLDPATRYLGAVSHQSGATEIARTLVSVGTP